MTMKSPCYQVERVYQNFVTGERRTEMRPKIYKTYRGAEKAAQRSSFATVNRHGVRIDQDARVVEVQS